MRNVAIFAEEETNLLGLSAGRESSDKELNKPPEVNITMAEKKNVKEKRQRKRGKKIVKLKKEVIKPINPNRFGLVLDRCIRVDGSTRCAAS